jgi:hypothetical protein
MTATLPRLSVILGIEHEYQEVRRTLRCLQQQSIAAHLEIVLVMPQALPIPAADFSMFWGWQSVISTLPNYADGIRAAQAEFVVFSEEHSFPLPDWAAALLAACDAPQIAVVSPLLHNANPRTLLSWGYLFAHFGQWLLPARQIVIEGITHNSLYRKAVLLEQFADNLAEVLNSEVAMHRVLRAKGYEIVFDPRAQTRHINISRWSFALRSQFYGGQLFGGERSRYWSARKRLLYALGVPLVPFLRVWRLRESLRRYHQAGKYTLIPLLIYLWGLLFVAAAGEFVGYMWGSTLETKLRTEKAQHHRLTKITPTDRWAIEQEFGA